MNLQAAKKVSCFSPQWSIGCIYFYTIQCKTNCNIGQFKKIIRSNHLTLYLLPFSCICWIIPSLLEFKIRYLSSDIPHKIELSYIHLSPICVIQINICTWYYLYLSHTIINRKILVELIIIDSSINVFFIFIFVDGGL